ncbi:MAG: crossover junction endodeoxyribonuclease RuvC [Holosporaceae bacterium]|jgi:Holliday junction resolvasome RuvABC endonuclease subunit|nr:crossover junction endodeoxyribonuclease RuvC [Holosporaceae bacterium]
MNILALDLGTLSGYAIEKDGKIISGVKKLRHDKRVSGIRALDFYRWLTQMIQEHSIEQVYFERVYAHSGAEAAHLYGYFMHTLAAVCEEYGIKCVGFSVGTIKKFATGKGNATKEEMIAAAKLRGFDPQTDDEADALAILFLALKTNAFRSTGPSMPWERAGKLPPLLF